MPLKISDEEIAYAEQILLKKGEFFDSERITFIKNLETIDLQAVPGSGKTTALLAKLLAIEKHLPFKDGSAILVISHTNAAVNQIENKIGKYCPRLFAYPNFIGTIQSFVDKFLTIPFGYNFLGVRFKWIDTELYHELLWKKFQSIYWLEDFEKPGTFFYRRHIDKCLKISKNDRKKAADLCNYEIEKEVKDIFFDFLDCSIKNITNEKVLFRDLKNSKCKGIKAIIDEIIDKEIISYEYSYKIAKTFIKKIPIIKKLIRKRFKFVFVDEMQDMGNDQYQLLDDLFHCDGLVFQRIGDKNQAIFSPERYNHEGTWIDRQKRLPMKGSYRLSQRIAQVVNNFALDTTYKIEGKGNSNLVPCMIVFSENSIDQVLPKFITLINERIPKEVISDSSFPIKLIGWRKEAEGRCLGIKNFYKDFDSNAIVSRIFHSSLKNHLTFCAKSIKGKCLLNDVRKNILESFIVILRKEEIVQTNGKYFNNNSLHKYLKENHNSFYEDFKLKVYLWSIDVYKEKIEEVLYSIKAFIPDLLGIFKKSINKSLDFINSDEPIKAQDEIELKTARKDNVYRCPNSGIEVKIGTVHSAKGETHLATLYVETYYNKKYESERLSCCFCGETKTFQGSYDKESVRIAYVAMSRPTYLLCFAIHQAHFDIIKDRVSGWEIHYA